MKKIDENMKLFEQILNLIANQFGSNCEVVLHDLTKDYNQTILKIINGHITNRTVGGCGSNLGLEVLRGTAIDGDRFNYVTHTPNGRILRSSSVYIRDDDGKVIGSICVNCDITETVRLEGFLKDFNHYEIIQEEVFANDVNNLLDYLIHQGQSLVKKPYDEMTKDEKIEFIAFLDRKGAFLITKSGEKICELLKISKFTLYKYLDLAREKGE